MQYLSNVGISFRFTYQDYTLFHSIKQLMNTLFKSRLAFEIKQKPTYMSLVTLDLSERWLGPLCIKLILKL